MAKKIDKIYQSIRFPYFYTSVFFDGKEIRIGFESVTKMGSRYLYGKYGTSDPKIQEQLEKSPSFNVEYRLIQTTETETGEPEEKNIPPVSGQISPAKTDDPKTSIPEVIRIQDARDYLIKNLKKTFKDVISREKILQLAKDNKIEFPNLK